MPGLKRHRPRFWVGRGQARGASRSPRVVGSENRGSATGNTPAGPARRRSEGRRYSRGKPATARTPPLQRVRRDMFSTMVRSSPVMPQRSGTRFSSWFRRGWAAISPPLGVGDQGGVVSGPVAAIARSRRSSTGGRGAPGAPFCPAMAGGRSPPLRLFNSSIRSTSASGQPRRGRKRLAHGASRGNRGRFVSTLSPVRGDASRSPNRTRSGSHIQSHASSETPTLPPETSPCDDVPPDWQYTP
jgi:hypothetical protein